MLNAQQNIVGIEPSYQAIGRPSNPAPFFQVPVAPPSKPAISPVSTETWSEEAQAAFRQALVDVSRLPVSVEVIGSWIWVWDYPATLNTKLLDLGFIFSDKRHAYYFRHPSCSSKAHGNANIEIIRSKYKSRLIRTQEQMLKAS